MCPSSFTGKYNSNKDELEELGMIYLKLTNILTTTSEISINQPKIGKGLIQWALVPLGLTLIYTIEDMSYFL